MDDPRGTGGVGFVSRDEAEVDVGLHDAHEHVGQIGGALSLLPFAPTVDGAVLPEAPLEAITDGTPGWAPYTTPNRTTALLTDHVTQVDDPAGDERSLWDGIR